MENSLLKVHRLCPEFPNLQPACVVRIPFARAAKQIHVLQRLAKV